MRLAALDAWRLRRILANERASARELAWAWRKISRRERERARYERIVALERWLASGGRDLAAPVESEILRWAPLVAERAAAQARPATARPLAMVLRPLALVALALLVVVGVTLQQGPMSEDERWQARGDDAAPVALRAFCHLGGDGAAVRALSDEPGPLALRECPAGGVIMLAYSSSRAGSLWLVRGDGAALGDALVIDEAPTLRELPVVLERSDAGADGELELVAVFSTSPLDAAAAVSLATDAAPGWQSESDTFVVRKEVRFAKE